MGMFEPDIRKEATATIMFVIFIWFESVCTNNYILINGCISSKVFPFLEFLFPLPFVPLAVYFILMSLVFYVVSCSVFGVYDMIKKK